MEKTRKCIDNLKCENFLDIGSYYATRESRTRSNCYSVLIKDKKERFKGSVCIDFKKFRFE